MSEAFERVAEKENWFEKEAHREAGVKKGRDWHWKTGGTGLNERVRFYGSGPGA